MSANVIPGLQIHTLATHADERGFFREVLRCDNSSFSAKQMSHSLVHTGVTKAWHGHVGQSQMTYLAEGSAIFAFVDTRAPLGPERPVFEILAGEGIPPWVAIHPPGVLIGYKCTQGPAHVFYATSGTYDPEDEVRVEWNAPTIPYSWEKWSRIR